MSEQIIYCEHLSNPWFTHVYNGVKTCEGRLYKNRFCNYKEGDIIEWYNDDLGIKNVCLTKIINVKTYATFEEYINDKGLDKCLPDVPDLEHGLGEYYKFYTKENENKYGVVAFELKRLV